MDKKRRGKACLAAAGRADEDQLLAVSHEPEGVIELHHQPFFQPGLPVEREGLHDQDLRYIGSLDTAQSRFFFPGSIFSCNNISKKALIGGLFSFCLPENGVPVLQNVPIAQKGEVFFYLFIHYGHSCLLRPGNDVH